MLNGSGRVFRLVTFRFRRVAFRGGTTEAAFTTACRGTTFWTTETTTLARLTGLPRLATATAHHLTQLLRGLDVFLFGDAAIGVRVHAFEHFLGITQHAHAGTTAFGAALTTRTTCAIWRTAWTVSFWRAFRFIAFTAWGTTESALTTTLRAAFWAAHPLPFSTTAHHLGDLADLVLINKTVAVGVHFAKALLAFLAAHAGEFFFADFAITIGVGAFDEFGETCARIAASLLWASGRPAGLTAFRKRTFAFAFLSTGEAGQAQDSEAVDE